MILGDFFIWSATAFVDSGCAYPKSQVRIEGDNKIYERDADSGFKIRFSFLPDLRQHHFVALAARTGRQQRLLGRRPNPNTHRITVGSFADPNFPAPTYSAWEEVMRPWLGVATATGYFPQGRPLTRLTRLPARAAASVIFQKSTLFD